MYITIIIFNNNSEKVLDACSDYNNKCEILNELMKEDENLFITKIIYSHVSSLGMEIMKCIDCKNIPYEKILYDYI